MNAPFSPSPITRALAGLCLALGSSLAAGAGFQLNESSASGLGNAFAGGAAIAEDATTLWSNAAGMTRLTRPQGVAVLHLITPSIHFKDEGSKAATTGAQPLGGDGGDAGGLNVVPGLFVVAPLGPHVSAGVGVSAPWGLVTEYDADWIGRYQGTKSSIRTINLNPALAWKAGDRLSLGFGLNVQRISAEFNSQVNRSAALLGAGLRAGLPAATLGALGQATARLDSQVSVKGDDTATGWNAGLLWNLDADARVGLSYRSRIKYRIDGRSRVTSAPLPAAATPFAALAAAVDAAFDTPVTSQVELPAIANLSVFRQLDARWDVMVDAQWTEWSTIETLSFVRPDGSVLQSTPEFFKDSWKLALGANYRPGGPWTLRGGVAVDQTPVRTEFRTPRLPDADRTWLTLGAQYAPDSRFRFDVGAAYIWSRKATIDASGDAATGGAATYARLLGHYDSHTVVLSAQVGMAF